MKTENYFFKDSVTQRIANASGKFSNQFMREDTKNVHSSSKRPAEESIKMGGYEINVGKQAASIRVDMRQPVARHSEIWLG